MNLRLYVIYERPLDYPNDYVLRAQLAKNGEIEVEREPTCVGSLAECRAAVPAGLTNLGRDPRDQPQILEVWV